MVSGAVFLLLTALVTWWSRSIRDQFAPQDDLVEIPDSYAGGASSRSQPGKYVEIALRSNEARILLPRLAREQVDERRTHEVVGVRTGARAVPNPRPTGDRVGRRAGLIGHAHGATAQELPDVGPLDLDGRRVGHPAGASSCSETAEREPGVPRN